MCELLRANLYEFQKYNRESSDPPYFTLPRVQSIARQVSNLLTPPCFRPSAMGRRLLCMLLKMTAFHGFTCSEEAGACIPGKGDGHARRSCGAWRFCILWASSTPT